ncbi:uncharacterized protein G2W53_041557 [Senna tora]|uniref:Uncharacterized protein n=1 Tax=Senna tora TaxID=362788 RepID=A0A834W1J5_9FABA|nr:uncharacterized protein G2W53_041557 [Senna tora]
MGTWLEIEAEIVGERRGLSV